MRLPTAIVAGIVCLALPARALELAGVPPADRLGSVELQAAATSAAAQVETLSAERSALADRLDRLGAEIADRKRTLAPGTEPGPELTGLLQQSALLAGQLAAAETRLAAAEAAARHTADALARECDRELAGLQAPANGGGADRALLEQRLAVLRKVCAPPAAVARPPVTVPPGALRATETDDAPALRQKADFLRDREDRLRRHIAELDRRMDALSREKALARRVSELVDEQNLFDDDDRRLSISRTDYAMSAAGTPSGAGGSGGSVDSRTPMSAAAPAQSNSPSPGSGGGGSSGGGGAFSGTGSVGTSGGSGGGAGLSGGGSAGAGTLGGLSSPADAPSGGAVSQGSRQTVFGERPEEPRLGDEAAADDDNLEGLRAQREALAREAAKLHDAAQALDRGAATGK